jgi:glycosyltransferase involved in cell wall biosynthesis
MTSKIKVSVLCLTYNQVNYVGQMLDSVLSQKTNFKFEVLINDDASNDGTVDTVKSYQKKYPDIIKPVFHSENLYSKGIRNFIPRYLLPKAQGVYLAICEGDDYWTDPNKLQLQVDFLNKNPEYALCFHPVIIKFENQEEDDAKFPIETSKSYFVVKQLIKRNFIHTNSVMYRSQDYSTLEHITPGDWYLNLYHAQFGKIGFIDKTMAVYRRHEKGIWWDAYKNKSKFWQQHALEYFRFYEAISKIYGHDKMLNNTIKSAVNDIFSELLETEIKNAKELIASVIKQYPTETRIFLIDQHNQLIKSETKVGELEKINEGLKLEIEQALVKPRYRYVTKRIKTILRFVKTRSKAILSSKNIYGA